MFLGTTLIIPQISNKWNSEKIIILKFFLLLATTSALLRVVLWLVYQPIDFPDTGTYVALATQLQELNFSHYSGVRTPIYPLLLQMGQLNYQSVWLIQSILGISISLILFILIMNHSANVVLAFVVGTVHSLSLNQLFWEANIVNETLATFFIVLSVVLLTRTIQQRNVANGVFLGVIAALAALTRPLYVYLGPLYLMFLLMSLGMKVKRVLISFSIAFVLPVFGWAVFNKATVDYFGLTTIVGYNLSQHSGGFMEKAPERYADIRDIYLKYRQERLRESKTHSMTIWVARQEIKDKTGMSDVALSNELTKLSLQLFTKYPALYARSVTEAWASFWAVPNYWKLEKIDNSGVVDFLNSVWKTERYALIVMNFVFLCVGGYAIIEAMVNRCKGTTRLDVSLILSCVVISASGLQAMLEFGENGRYSIPTQPLVTSLVLMSVWAWAGKIGRSVSRSRLSAAVESTTENKAP
jgi:hypothetical protein